MLNEVIARYTSRKPVYDFIAPGDGFGHTFWVIDDEQDIETITREFAKMPALYIADGHHRSAAAALVGAEKAKNNPHHRGDEEYNYFMAVCFPAGQLTIIDYNRVVRDRSSSKPWPSTSTWKTRESPSLIARPACTTSRSTCRDIGTA